MIRGTSASLQLHQTFTCAETLRPAEVQTNGDFQACIDLVHTVQYKLRRFLIKLSVSKENTIKIIQVGYNLVFLPHAPPSRRIQKHLQVFLHSEKGPVRFSSTKNTFDSSQREAWPPHPSQRK
ncbi:hypothetical protein FQA47_000738 [Oryzias melastigma]|uniref:Uncharacterized protein n=1 Tax=Oryzias melastigma TaxID=30732 RepID=A0A834CIC5_ORYME|nr:hypothetical protein FQA47_000738 [Oryzias melastigma]